jgi:MoaA/NifB/PqqE/SkfB family radical SAM enzyme
MALNKYVELMELTVRMLRNRQISFRKVSTAVRNGWAAMLRRPVAGGAPSAVIIEPVNFCNLKCAGCGCAMCGQIRKAETLSFDRFCRIFDDVKDDLLFLVLEIAGEPFLNKELLAMVDHAFKQRVPTITSTNADFETGPDWGEQVVQSRLDTLIVSISGHDNASHAQYHRKGRFDRVIGNLRKVSEARRRLRAANPVLIVRFIETELNRSSVAVVRRQYREWGADKLDVRPTAVDQFTFRPSQDGTVQIRIRGELEMCYPNFCPNLYFIPAVLVDGSVMPCCFVFLFPPVLGNALTGGGLRAVWNNQQYQEMRRQVALNRMRIPACTACGGGLGYQGANWNRSARFEISTPYHKGAGRPPNGGSASS